MVFDMRCNCRQSRFYCQSVCSAIVFLCLAIGWLFRGAACTTCGNVGRSVALRGHACCAGGRLFFDGERFSIKMLLTANFILVKLITVNLEEAKLPVKNFYTSSSAMFSSGSYWDVATALSFYSPGVAPTRNLLLLDRSVNEKEPALWRVLSVWATCAGLWSLGNRGQKRRGGGSFSLSIYLSFGVFVFLNPKRVSAEPTRVATVSTAQSAGSQLRLGTNS